MSSKTNKPNIIKISSVDACRLAEENGAKSYLNGFRLWENPYTGLEKQAWETGWIYAKLEKPNWN